MRSLLVRVACLVLLIASTLLAQSSASDPVRARLERAKAGYAADLERAKKRLMDEFESVVQSYTKAGKLDDALAVRKERDEFLEKSSVTVAAGDPATKVEDGWTILFRSANPLLWNVAVQNSDSYSVPVDRAPGTMRYLRMRRIDTTDFVIIALQQTELSKLVVNGSSGWRGDKSLWDNAAFLGVINTTRKISKRGEIQIHDSFSGWGFGNRGWIDDHQGYCWNGQPIEATVLEIAVTARDLKPDEQKKLLK